MLSELEIKDCEQWSDEGMRPEMKWAQSGSSLLISGAPVMPCPLGLVDNATGKFDGRDGYYIQTASRAIGPFSNHIAAQLGAEMLIRSGRIAAQRKGGDAK